VNQSNSNQVKSEFSEFDRFRALVYGVGSLSLFATSVVVMLWSLYHGWQFGVGTFTGRTRWIANFFLLAQFPILHSWLLSRSGNRRLDPLAPKAIATHLRPTTYVAVASLQLLAAFCFWSPQSDVIWRPSGLLLRIHVGLFAVSWILLAKSMWDGHLGVQLGYLGWWSVIKRLPAIPWPGLRTAGLFRICRQPIYFSFMLTLWTGPVWTTDKIFTAALWSLYCLFGPLLKERRQMRIFGARFAVYKSAVSYWPSLNILRLKDPE